mmetsp:Transcript_16783/g.58687  ORF Transcript_16783/g.58687 Transcript_16783/m.58687 type:complete len:244 (-) Transcript_16783:486-1217(-)
MSARLPCALASSRNNALAISEHVPRTDASLPSTSRDHAKAPAHSTGHATGSMSWPSTMLPDRDRLLPTERAAPGGAGPGRKPTSSRPAGSSNGSGASDSGTMSAAAAAAEPARRRMEALPGLRGMASWPGRAFMVKDRPGRHASVPCSGTQPVSARPASSSRSVMTSTDCRALAGSLYNIPSTPTTALKSGHSSTPATLVRRVSPNNDTPPGAISAVDGAFSGTMGGDDRPPTPMPTPPWPWP